MRALLIATIALCLGAAVFAFPGTESQREPVDQVLHRETVAAMPVARSMPVRRSVQYVWRKQYRRCGLLGLRCRAVWVRYRVAE